MLAVTDAIEEAIVFEGPETVAAVYLEPVQNAGGCYVPPEGYFQRVREICDKYGVLLVSDEVICAFGRLGHWFGAERYDYLPDMITCAKGITSGYSPLGAVICRDFLAEPFLEGKASFAHGLTFGGHPVSCAVALANLDVFEREHILGARARAGARAARASRRAARAPDRRRRARRGLLPGRSSWSRTRRPRSPSPRAEREELLRGFLLPRFLDEGLIARADDRAEPVVQLSPPLIAGPEEFDVIVDDPPEGLHRGVGAVRRVNPPLTVGVPREVKKGEHRVAVDARRGLRAARPRRARARRARRRRGLLDHRRRLPHRRRRDRRRRRGGLGARRPRAQGEGAPGGGVRPAPPRPRAVHVPAPRRLSRRGRRPCSSAR